eukprot:1153489-Pelagomonas_calceolata.AAC.2
MDLVLTLSTLASIAHRRNPILPRCTFHIQSVNSQPELADIFHDMLKQIHMQVPRQPDGFAHIAVKR